MKENLRIEKSEDSAEVLYIGLEPEGVDEIFVEYKSLEDFKKAFKKAIIKKTAA